MRVGFVGVFLAGGAGSSKECLAGFDMEVHEVEDDAVGEVTEAYVVVHNTLAGVDHFDPVEVCFVHGFEVGDLHVNSLEV